VEGCGSVLLDPAGTFKSRVGPRVANAALSRRPLTPVAFAPKLMLFTTAW